MTSLVIDRDMHDFLSIDRDMHDFHKEHVAVCICLILSIVFQIIIVVLCFRLLLTQIT